MKPDGQGVGDDRAQYAAYAQEPKEKNSMGRYQSARRVRQSIRKSFYRVAVDAIHSNVVIALPSRP